MTQQANNHFDFDKATENLPRHVKAKVNIFYGNERLYHVYPDWNEKVYGPRVIAGTIRANNTFEASRIAYELRIVPMDYPLVFKELKTKASRPIYRRPKSLN
jgi:hypothetical protein